MPKNKRLTPKQEAEMLFDLYHAGDSETAYEIGCVLDEYVNAGNRVYSERKLFILTYLSARAEGEDDDVLAILSEIQKGATPKEIAGKLRDGNGTIMAEPQQAEAISLAAYRSLRSTHHKPALALAIIRGHRDYVREAEERFAIAFDKRCSEKGGVRQ
jgi:hypothetical protein